MFDLEYDISKSGEEKHHIILQEYDDIFKEIKEDLELCKAKQNDIYSNLQSLYVESKNSSNAMRDSISRIHLEECCNNDVQNEIITNLKEQIAILKTEKDSALQVGQMLLKTMDALEQKLKTEQIYCKDAQSYEERLEIIKQSYSEAIKTLENKLLKAKEDVAKQKFLLITNNETIEMLKREKQEMENKLQDLQRTVQQKDENNQHRIQSLTEELFAAKAEIKKLKDLNSNLEERLKALKTENKRIFDNVMTKNEETKCKMAEALDLLEYAIKEKDIVLEREAKLAEQNVKLEARLASIAEEHAIKMQEEIAKLKDAHEHDVKKYLLEIKELKSELRDKVTLLDRLQRENTLKETEMENFRQFTEDLLEKSANKLLEINFDQASKLETCNETCKIHSLEIERLQKKIINLEENLVISNDKLKQIQQQTPTNVQDYTKTDDEERTKDVIDRYIHLESQLIKATNDKESLTTKLKALQSAFDNEIRKRDDERCMMENKIRELEINLEKEKYIRENKSDISICPVQVSSQHCPDTMHKHTLDIHIENMDHKWQSLLAEKMMEQQKCFDKKMKMVEDYVRIYQELSKSWANEIKALTEKFQAKYKELRLVIGTLQKKNVELESKLLLTKRNILISDALHSNIKQSETVP